MTAVEYIQSLERKVEELEGLLGRESSGSQHTSTPMSPPSRLGDGMELENETPRQTISPAKTTDIATASMGATSRTAASTVTASSATARPGQPSTSGSDEDVIETMVGAGEYDSPHASSFERYRGSFAGLSLLRRVHNLCKRMSGSQDPNGNSEELQDDFIHAFDFESPDHDSSIPWDAFALLPSRESFDRAVDVVVNQACCNLQFLDRPTLERIANQVYAESESESRHMSRKPFALLYAVVALSRRFEPGSPKDAGTTHRGYVI